MKLVRTCVLACIALAAAFPVPRASAAIVTLQFQGVVTFKLGTTVAGAASGNTFTGTAVYDTSSPGAPSGSGVFYAGALQSFSVTYNTSSGPAVVSADIISGPITVGQGGTAGVAVTNDELDANMIDMFDRFRVLGGSTTSSLSMILEGISKNPAPAAGPLSSLSPPESFDINGFNFSHGFTVSRAPSSQFPGLNVLQGNVTSVTFIPAPAAAAPLLGIALLAARRRR